MTMDWKWAFDGIGTALLTLLITGVTAGIVYKKVTKKSKQVQKQKGGKHSNLYQAGKNITHGKRDEE
jgi:hypothetical protein